MKTLLVEDDDLQKVIIEETLRKADPDIELTQADTLHGALEAVQAQRFQVILLDLGLPDSSGIDTLSLIHERVPQTPIVVLTAASEEGLGTLCVQAGAQDFLQKQKLSPETLYQSLEFAVHRKTGSVLLDIHRVLSQLKTLAPGESEELTKKFSSVYCRLLTEPRFLMTPEHQMLTTQLGQAGASAEQVVALHSRCLAHVCSKAKNVDRVRYVQNSSAVILATMSYLVTYYQDAPAKPTKKPSLDEAPRRKSGIKRSAKTKEALAKLRARRAAKKKAIEMELASLESQSGTRNRSEDKISTKPIKTKSAARKKSKVKTKAKAKKSKTKKKKE